MMELDQVVPGVKKIGSQGDFLLFKNLRVDEDEQVNQQFGGNLEPSDDHSQSKLNSD